MQIDDSTNSWEAATDWFTSSSGVGTLDDADLESAPAQDGGSCAVAAACRDPRSASSQQSDWTAPADSYLG
jgi:hypothetical protein